MFLLHTRCHRIKLFVFPHKVNDLKGQYVVFGEEIQNENFHYCDINEVIIQTQTHL